MKKIITIVTAVLMISSCFPIDNRSNVMIVNRIKQIDRNTDEIHFFFMSGVNRQELEIYDFANKWNIGDTLKLSK